MFFIPIANTVVNWPAYLKALSLIAPQATSQIDKNDITPTNLFAFSNTLDNIIEDTKVHPAVWRDSFSHISYSFLFRLPYDLVMLLHRGTNFKIIQKYWAIEDAVGVLSGTLADWEQFFEKYEGSTYTDAHLLATVARQFFQSIGFFK
jgi:hypothetical protein